MEVLLFILVLFVVFIGGGWLLGKCIGNWIFGKDEDENPYNRKK